MTTKTESAELFKQAISGVSAENDADVIAFSGPIDSPADEELIGQIEQFRSKPNIFLLLTTNGGSADAAYRIARCLQHGYRNGKVILFVDTYCKSAGTLIALGADEIVMSDLAELGPLDVQMSKSDELAEMTSGLTPVQALNVLRDQTFETFEDHFLKLRFRSGLQITTKTALDIAARLTIGLFEKVYEQLDPMRLGEYQRAMLIAHEYGTRIAQDNLKDDALNRLIASYPSHAFIIDREEASTLFCHVREPKEPEALLAAFIKPMAHAALRRQDGAEIQFLSHAIPDQESKEEEDHGTNATDSEEVPPPAGPRSESPTRISGPQPVSAAPHGNAGNGQ